jgi:predicted peroxiredoxin
MLSRASTGEEVMRITYLVITGAGNPTRASLGLHIAANGSLEAGQQPVIVLGGDGTELVLDDNAERIEGIGVPPARELLAKLREHDVPVFV